MLSIPPIIVVFRACTGPCGKGETIDDVVFALYLLRPLSQKSQYYLNRSKSAKVPHTKHTLIFSSM